MASKSMQATIYGVDQASPVFRKVAGAADDMATDAEKAGDKFGGAFKKGASMAAGALATIGFADFARDTIAQASAMEQNIGAMQAVFKDTSGAIEDFGRTSAEQVGIAKQDYYQLAAVFGSQLKNMGVAADQLAPKTNQLVTLGADLAAVYGGSASDAVDAISSLLRGERDPIERYGVSIKQASINAYEMANGLDTSTAAAKTNADMQATLALLFQQTGDAQGQFAAQTDTLAESQQIATAKFKEAQAEIGQKLLPIVTDLTNFAANDLVPVLSDVADGIGGVISVIDKIPGPVKLALTAMLGWKLFQQTNTFSKLAAGARGFREEMVLQQSLAKAGGQELSNLGAAAATARTRLSGVGKQFLKGGAIFAGIAVVSAIVDGFTHVNESVKAVTESAEDLGKQLADNNLKWDDSIQKAYTSAVTSSDVFKALIADGADYGKTLAALTGRTDLYSDAAQEVQKHFGALSMDQMAAIGPLLQLKTQTEQNAKSLNDYNKRVAEATAQHKASKAAQDAYVAQLEHQHDVATGAAQSVDQLASSTLDAKTQYEASKNAQDAYVDGLLRQHAAAVKANDAMTDWASIGGRVSDAVLGTAQAMKEANDQAHDLTQGATELETALARLSGREPTVEEATRAFNGALTQMKDAAKDADGHVQRLGDGVIKASGQIDTGTKAGQDLYDNVTSVAKAAQDAALAQASLAGATGGTTAAADAAAKSLAASRDQFIKNHDAMGLTEQQAKDLADAYFGIPSDIKTVVTGIANFTDVDNKIQALQDNTISVDVQGKYRGTVGLPANYTGGPNGGLASGGPALPGQSYWVGENGPEILTMYPGSGGWVTNARQAAGLRSVTLPGRASGGSVGNYTPPSRADLAGLQPIQLGPVLSTVTGALEDFRGSVAATGQAAAAAASDASSAAEAYKRQLASQHDTAVRQKELVARANKSSQQDVIDAKKRLAELKKTAGDSKAARDHVATAERNLEKARAARVKTVRDAIRAQTAANRAEAAKTAGARKAYAQALKDAAETRARAQATAKMVTATRSAAREQSKLADQLDKTNNALAAAKTTLAGLRDSSAQLSSSVASRLVGDSSIMNLDANGVPGLISGLRSYLNSDKGFASSLSKLANAGLDNDILQQVAGGGLAALPLAKALAGASPAQIKQLNSLQAQIRASSSRSGGVVADAEFASLIKAQKETVVAYQTTAKDITKLMGQNAAQLEKAMKVALNGVSFQISMDGKAIEAKVDKILDKQGRTLASLR